MMHELDLDLNVWRTITLGLLALGQTCFAVLYGFFPFYRTFLGRALFYKAMTFAVLVDMYILTRFWEVSHADELFVALYALLAVGVWWQFFAFLRVWKKARRDKALALALDDLNDEEALS